MIKTEYGNFDGNRWEDACQIVFKRRYENDSYFEIPATPGDFGIEGFTRRGKAFQCYCPDEYYSTSELYEKQRDKITKDLKKLKTYESQLSKKLGGTIIKQWFFVSPMNSKNDLVDHCTKKRDEVKSWGLSIIDNSSFEVIPADIGFLKPEIYHVLKIDEQKIDITPTEITTEEDKLKWKDKKISLVENAQRKHKARFESSANNLDKKVDSLTEKSISHFLEGNGILKKWQSDYPEDYEKFIKIISQVEEQVIEECMFQEKDNNILYRSFSLLVEEKVKESFPYLDNAMVVNLCNQVMADWI
jgi:uncharacterized protein (UPF0210 family)